VIHKKHVELQAIGGGNTSLDHLHDVALAAPLR